MTTYLVIRDIDAVSGGLMPPAIEAYVRELWRGGPGSIGVVGWRFDEARQAYCCALHVVSSRMAEEALFAASTAIADEIAAQLDELQAEARP